MTETVKNITVNDVDRAISEALGRERCKAFLIVIKRIPYYKTKEEEVKSDEA